MRLLYSFIAVLSGLFFATTYIKAQQPAPGSYLSNNYVTKFEGTWRWTSGNDTVTIRLKKLKTQLSNYEEDILMGTHSYIKNGRLVESSMNRFDSISSNNKKRTIFLWNDQSADTSKTKGYIRDISRNKDGEIYLEYTLNGSTPQLIWQIKVAEGAYYGSHEYGLTLPREIILTKQ